MSLEGEIGTQGTTSERENGSFDKLEQGITNTPKEQLGISPEALRARYEVAYRNVRAEEYNRERLALHAKRRAIEERWGPQSRSDEVHLASNEGLHQSDIERARSVLADIERDRRVNQGLQNSFREVIQRRGLRSKVIHQFIDDPEKDRLKELIAGQRELDEIIAKKQQEIAGLEEDAKRARQEAETRIGAVYEERKTSDIEGVDQKRQELFDKVREVNKASKEASITTAELIQEGALEVSKLVRELNVLVVHALPLEGWSMKNTSMNNREVEVEALSPQEKIATVVEKQPDISATIVHLNPEEVHHKTMYPFGLILDGTLIASYREDSSTITKGDARYRKYANAPTLQANPVDEFKRNATQPGTGMYGWNESIIHKPIPKGIFIDAEHMKPVVSTDDGSLYDHYGDQTTEYYLPEQEAEIMGRYGKEIKSIGRGTPKTGPYAGKPVFMIERSRSGVEKAIDFAKKNYPDLPVYIRHADGVYDQSGTKVDANTVYS